MRPAGWPAGVRTSAATAGCWTTALEQGALGRALETPLPAELRESLLAGPTHNDD